jgi:DNA-binding transcriptional ArsR family regulator
MKKPKTQKTHVHPEALKALADPTRMKIMLMLEGRRRTVNEIVEFFDLSQPTISRHLQTLADAGLVTREKQGQKVHYSINGNALSAICVGLASCFPCCCVTVTPTSIPENPRKKMKSKKGGAR